MTGPEHYQEAERLVAIARGDGLSRGEAPRQAEVTLLLTEAQVHATLALAAATAMAALNCDGRPFGMSKVDFDAWDRVAGEPNE